MSETRGTKPELEPAVLAEKDTSSSTVSTKPRSRWRLSSDPNTIQVIEHSEVRTPPVYDGSDFP